MTKPPPPPPSRTADQFVVRFPEGMRDEIAEAAKGNNRSMNAEIVARLQASFRAPSIRVINERRKLELLAEYIAWCDRSGLAPEKSFSAFAKSYADAAAAEPGEPSNLATVSSIDEVDAHYLSELYANWIIERPSRFPQLADGLAKTTAPASTVSALSDMIAILQYEVAEREFELHIKTADIGGLKEELHTLAIALTDQEVSADIHVQELAKKWVIKDLDKLPDIDEWQRVGMEKAQILRKLQSERNRAIHRPALEKLVRSHKK